MDLIWAQPKSPKVTQKQQSVEFVVATEEVEGSRSVHKIVNCSPSPKQSKRARTTVFDSALKRKSWMALSRTLDVSLTVLFLSMTFAAGNYDFTAVWAAEECTCGMLLVDGAPSKDGLRCRNFPDRGNSNILYGNKDYGLGATRCCTDDGKKGDSFCSHSCELVDYDTAVDTCAEKNMRLCTKEEVLANDVAGTGCSYDFTYVWTSSEGCTA